MSLGLKGVAFITGAGGAIGRSCAVQFARDGVRKIAGADLSEKALDETASTLKEQFPDVTFLKLVANLTDENAVNSIIEKTAAEFGRIDYAVNNAGIASAFVRTTEGEHDNLKKVLDVNVSSVWLCQRAQLRQMLKQEPLPASVPGRVESRGSIINIGSVLSHLAMATIAPYTMSKHAIVGLTRTDALDYAKDQIRVNTVCPGFVDTPLVTPATRKLLKGNIDKTPMGRLANTQEIADAVVFLASDRASYITGSNFVVDGGYSIH